MAPHMRQDMALSFLQHPDSLHCPTQPVPHLLSIPYHTIGTSRSKCTIFIQLEYLIITYAANFSYTSALRPKGRCKCPISGWTSQYMSTITRNHLSATSVLENIWPLNGLPNREGLSGHELALPFFLQQHQNGSNISKTAIISCLAFGVPTTQASSVKEIPVK